MEYHPSIDLVASGMCYIGNDCQVYVSSVTERRLNLKDILVSCCIDHLAVFVRNERRILSYAGRSYLVARCRKREENNGQHRPYFRKPNPHRHCPSTFDREKRRSDNRSATWKSRGTRHTFRIDRRSGIFL